MVSEAAILCDDRGVRLAATARVPTRSPAAYADLLVKRLHRHAVVEPLPGGYRLVFGIGEVLLVIEGETLALLVSADAPAALAQLRDALGTQLEHVGRLEHLRVAWR
ncbi:DUF2218 domain-containing protein [Glycomyces algeriensis]|uniref:DUF2218 domain-containing protein n=1 Tax=Glycomyces algeriensis TaxID=256037 RepID=A0A9W6LIK7_9ACTN|nr:DUF2218 domain-containing protein [Glycomyces algeriensis]MDA1368322.1 DUF2218 domain-containing protein [Glycomyces algeriensis]MDR7351763.1 hypothetical protein [Glycomyces algeriensis]GLI44490.1 hypothetical protein GALLR39Z86_43400 [Glycomyces algeriensis]